MSPTFNQTADGCFHLSLNDLLAWERAVRARALLKPDSWSKIFTPVVLNSAKTHPYGFAGRSHSATGRRCTATAARFGAFEAILTRYIEDDVTIIALANLVEVDLKQMADGVAKLMRQSSGSTQDMYTHAPTR